MSASPGRRAAVITALAVVAVVVLLASFLLGSRMRAAAAPVARVVATPTVAPVPAATPEPAAHRRLGPSDVGSRRWDALTGGECLRIFGSPWKVSYPVVACRAAHAAQLTRRIVLTGSTYPSRAALAARLGSTCDNAVPASAAARYGDVRVTSAYPTAARWAAGDRAAFCFVFRAGGGALLGSLATTRD